MLIRRLIIATFIVSFPAMCAAERASANAEFDRKSYERAVSKAIAFLKSKGQADDGSFTKQAGIGVTALVTTGLLRHGVSPGDANVAKSLKFLESFAQRDGGIYQTGSLYRNYETCLSILCFTEANKDGRYDKIIQRADAFVKGIQWGEGKDVSDPAYGGGGYGHKKRPDLSNTAFLVEALRAAGNDENSDAVKRALIFVSRCQNLESERNTTPFGAKVNDGGFYYTPVAGGSSQAGESNNGGLRSYGTMTYAGLKSMLYAGVGADDPRVKAAVKWAQKNYTLQANPGLGDAGLFYYYHLFAKALDATGQSIVEDVDGTKHVWRNELLTELAARQQSDGSWVNENSKWLEGDTNLVTGYALLALSHCRPTNNASNK